ncbi:hypothetical protein WJU16_15420 [Chitinophaga pollutisoli]|uniref:Lipoprotein n=1 Tax=Chitinophaga pollutisoli TaxID=3133966 RepID=A0ABZ2YIW2_9BACT
MKHYFNTNKVLSVTALAIGAITIFFACKKDDTNPANNDQKDNNTIAVATSEATVTAIYEDVFTTTLEYNNTELPPSGRQAPEQADNQPCFPGVELVPADLSVYPKILTLDFGTGCTDGNGITRKGKIKISLAKLFWLADSKANITFENYSVNGIKVEGSVVVTTSAWGDAKKTYSYTVTNGKVTHPNGYTATYNGTRTVTQTEGAATLSLRDDLYAITGNATLVDNLGTATVAITKPLQRRITCAWIAAGEVSVSLNGHAGTINYGSDADDCDNKATLTIGDKTKEITF